MSFPSISMLFDLAERSSLLLVTAMIATLMLRKSLPAVRYGIWTLAVSASLCVPLARLLPAWPILSVSPEQIVRQDQPADHFSEPHSVLPQVFTTDASMAANPVNCAGAVITIWEIGFGISLLIWALGSFYLHRLGTRTPRANDASLQKQLESACAELGVRRRIALLLRDGATMPMTWGVFRPTILLPEAAVHWSAARQRLVLLHEVAHVRRFDCLTDTIAQLARAMHWYNPLMWAGVWRMHIERERACDDAVLSVGVRPSIYAAELLDWGAVIGPQVGLAMARRSRLGRRVTELLDENRLRVGNVGRSIGLIAVWAIILIPLAIVRAGPPATTPAPNPNAATQPSDRRTDARGWTPPAIETSHRLRQLGLGAIMYMTENRGTYPDQLGQTLKYFGTNHSGRLFLTPGDERKTDVPAHPTAEWVHQHSSFVYLTSGTKAAKLPHPSETVMIHSSLDEPFDSDKLGPSIVLLFADGHSTIMGIDQARAAIARSIKAIDSAKVPSTKP